MLHLNYKPEILIFFLPLEVNAIKLHSIYMQENKIRNNFLEDTEFLNSGSVTMKHFYS